MIPALQLQPFNTPRPGDCPQQPGARAVFGAHYVITVDPDFIQPEKSRASYPVLNTLAYSGAALAHHIARQWSRRTGTPEDDTPTRLMGKNPVYGDLYANRFVRALKGRLAVVARGGQIHLLSAHPKLDKLIESVLKKLPDMPGWTNPDTDNPPDTAEPQPGGPAFERGEDTPPWRESLGKFVLENPADRMDAPWRSSIPEVQPFGNTWGESGGGNLFDWTYDPGRLPASPDASGLRVNPERIPMAGVPFFAKKLPGTTGWTVKDVKQAFESLLNAETKRNVA